MNMIINYLLKNNYLFNLFNIIIFHLYYIFDNLNEKNQTLEKSLILINTNEIIKLIIKYIILT